MVATVNSAVSQDVTGSLMGIGGIHLTALAESGIKGIPGVGLGLDLFGAGRDLFNTYRDYARCMSGG
jgi:hypothetical protein